MEYPERCISCYLFPNGKELCDDTGFSFPLDTFIYLDEIDDYDLKTFESVYPVEGIDYHILGSIKPIIKEELLNCIKNSSRVKRKIKKLIFP